ncbi:MAG: GTPase ObgE [Saprospiraceae bacterium]|nr:MAG: GTPase ObgE [Bacteroidetes bacterium OLB9]MCO6462644.1 GTPase ObgE [Saprospiraceae bacterium]MCZ2339997.1 GTPase ObgE [Chitinophagales bacterium]
MAEQNFVDYVKICCRSGSGGAGSSHFFRDNKTSKGGPDGGDGGRGGHIILRGNSNVWTLLALKYRKHVVATAGENGSKNNSTGRDGQDIILEVPLGTVARDFETGEIDFEITEHDETRILVSGGRGGKGNSWFKTATRQAPEYAQPGESGKELWKILELKVLADVGLVGFPNAGKSSFLASITAAKPEIAQYPFTTLVPNLGIVKYRDGRSFIIADIPGIIENAHQGKGLGLRFLRHIERNAVLLFMVSVESEDITKDYNILVNELKLYNPELMDKPRILAITKCDIIDDEYISLLKNDINVDVPFYFISSVSGRGLTELKDALWSVMNTHHD